MDESAEFDNQAFDTFVAPVTISKFEHETGAHQDVGRTASEPCGILAVAEALGYFLRLGPDPGPFGGGEPDVVGWCPDPG